MKGYVRLRGEKGFCYVKKECAENLCQVDAAIFDCDGVLVDVAPSYDRAIAKTVSLLMSKATGARFPSSLISRRIIYELRNSGGFNNDWDACYVLLIHIFSHLPR